jgi:hypothetical protein
MDQINFYLHLTQRVATTTSSATSSVRASQNCSRNNMCTATRNQKREQVRIPSMITIIVLSQPYREKYQFPRRCDRFDCGMTHQNAAQIRKHSKPKILFKHYEIMNNSDNLSDRGMIFMIHAVLDVTESLPGYCSHISSSHKNILAHLFVQCFLPSHHHVK